jgi:hypothetical protein
LQKEEPLRFLNIIINKLQLLCRYLHLPVYLPVVILFCACPMPLAAQCINYINTHQFLGTSGVFHIARDRTGFLWFCTDHGLIKYDGHSMQRFTRQNGMADNLIFNLYEDPKGRIWPFCANGRYCYIDGDSVHNEGNDTMLAKLPHTSSYITYMASATDTTLYMGFLSRQILSVNQHNGTWQMRNPEYNNGLKIEQNRISHTSDPPASITVFSGNRTLISDKEGIKILNRGRLYWQLNDVRFTGLVVTDLCLTGNDQLLVCSANGLTIIDLATGAQTLLLKGIRVSSCTTDIAGNFWIGTINDGIYQLHQELNHIQLLKGFDRVDWIRLNDDRIVSVKDGNLYELVADKDQLSAVPAIKNIPGYYNPLLLTSQLAAFHNTWSKRLLVQRHNGQVLLDTPIFFKKMHTAAGNKFFAHSAMYTSFFQADSNTIKLQQTIYYPDKITASAKDPASGNVYFISGPHLYKCNFSAVKNELLFSSPVLARASSLLVHDSRLLITTDTTGYYTLSNPGKNARLMYQSTAFIPYRFLSAGKESVLAMSDVADFLMPSPGSNNASRPIRYPFSISEYEHLNLLGKYYMVQVNGLTYYFDTALLNKHLPPSVVAINRLTINGRDYNTQEIDIRNTMKLDIQLRVDRIDFSKNTHGFRYRLVGPDLDGTWISTEAAALNLVLRKAGRYRIEIAPGEGAERFTPIVRYLNIHTPFLRSATFYVLCGITLFILSTLLFLRILRYRERHFIKEFGYLRLEHKAINALLNPHFIFNTINNIQGLIFRSKGQDAADYLSALSRLIRQNLENLQHNLIPLENELEMIGRYIALQNLRFEGRISLELCREDETVSLVQIPPLLVHTFVENAIVHGFRDKDQDFRIRIAISRQDDEYLQITITDNGMGMHQANEHPSAHQKTSMGIAFNQKRLERLSVFYNLRQSVAVRDLSSGGGRGTEVVILLYGKLDVLFVRHHLPAH